MRLVRPDPSAFSTDLETRIVNREDQMVPYLRDLRSTALSDKNIHRLLPAIHDVVKLPQRANLEMASLEQGLTQLLAIQSQRKPERSGEFADCYSLRYVVMLEEGSPKFLFGTEGVPEARNTIPAHWNLAGKVLAAGNCYFKSVQTDAGTPPSWMLVGLNNKSGGFKPSANRLFWPLFLLARHAQSIESGRHGFSIASDLIVEHHQMDRKDKVRTALITPDQFPEVREESSPKRQRLDDPSGLSSAVCTTFSSSRAPVEAAEAAASSSLEPSTPPGIA